VRSSNYLRQSKRRHGKSMVDTSIMVNGDDKIVGKDTLASLMDVTLTSIERWIREGMPVEQQGNQLSDWIFNLNEVKIWKRDN